MNYLKLPTFQLDTLAFFRVQDMHDTIKYTIIYTKNVKGLLKIKHLKDIEGNIKRKSKFGNDYD